MGENPNQGWGDSVYRFGEFELCERSFELRHRGQVLRVQNRPFDLLRFLLEHRGEVQSKDVLTRQVYRGDPVSEVSLRHAFHQLKRVLGQEAESYVRSIRGRGYVFCGDAEEILVTPQPDQPAPRARVPSAPGARSSRSLRLADLVQGGLPQLAPLPSFESPLGQERELETLPPQYGISPSQGGGAGNYPLQLRFEEAAALVDDESSLLIAGRLAMRLARAYRQAHDYESAEAVLLRVRELGAAFIHELPDFDDATGAELVELKACTGHYVRAAALAFQQSLSFEARGHLEAATYALLQASLYQTHYYEPLLVHRLLHLSSQLQEAEAQREEERAQEAAQRAKTGRRAPRTRSADAEDTARWRELQTKLLIELGLSLRSASGQGLTEAQLEDLQQVFVQATEPGVQARASLALLWQDGERLSLREQVQLSQTALRLARDEEDEPSLRLAFTCCVSRTLAAQGKTSALRLLQQERSQLSCSDALRDEYALRQNLSLAANLEGKYAEAAQQAELALALGLHLEEGRARLDAALARFQCDRENGELRGLYELSARQRHRVGSSKVWGMLELLCAAELGTLETGRKLAAQIQALFNVTELAENRLLMLGLASELLVHAPQAELAAWLLQELRARPEEELLGAQLPLYLGPKLRHEALCLAGLGRYREAREAWQALLQDTEAGSARFAERLHQELSRLELVLDEATTA